MKKKDKKSSWRKMGLILTSKEEFEEIYERYMKSENCELCGNPYKSSKDKHMDHIHFIDIYGWFRNTICTTCNLRKADRKKNITNTSGHKLISKKINKNCNQGYTWQFQAHIDGKQTTIKQSIDIDFLVKFRDEWTKKNNYYT